MTTTVTTPPATRPAQVTGSPQAFDAAKADWQAWMQTAVPQLNTQSAEVDTSLNLCSGYADSAGESATTTTTAAQAALAGANFKGAWSSLTGALNTPATVQHNGQVWLLTANLANVTTATPGVSSSWAPYSAVHPIDRADMAGVVQPTLDLNFAEQSYRVYDAATGGLQSVALSSIITYTGSGRTYTDALGILRAQASNVPRLEFDPVTGAGLGLSVWGARTNFYPYSEQFDDASWIKARCTVAANQTTAPDGTSTADKFVEDGTASNTHYIRRDVTGLTDNTVYTWSVFCKAGERTQIAVAIVSKANLQRGIGVDLTNGAIVPISGLIATGISYSVESFPNNWYRVSFSLDIASGATTPSFRAYMVSGGSLSYSGDSASSLFVWGAQLEAGSVASPYIPTTTAAVTAPADIATITGANFSKWFNAKEGTIVVTYRRPAQSDAANRHPISLTNNAAATLMLRVLTDGTRDWFADDANGTNVLDTTGTSAVAANALTTHAASYSATAFNASTAGGANEVATGFLPTADRLNIGHFNGALQVNGTISRVLYFPRELPANLQALSAT